MSEQITELTDKDFATHISSGITLVDFWAPWCGPCRLQSPILDQVAQKRQGQAKVAKVNIDDNPQAPSRYGVRGIPTLLIFKDGVTAFSGKLPPDPDSLIAQTLG